ncbi:MAG: lipocalin-like domain-containing protein [Gammaproteobacteria bacterium]|jgi:predicted secreted hydrolase
MMRVVALLLLGLSLAGCHQQPASGRDEGVSLGKALGGEPTTGFAQIGTPRAFHFPADHGPHPGFRNEWWYYTGVLHTEAGRRFGFELTFFRIALTPRAPVGNDRWLTNQIYMAHFAVTDVKTGRFHAWQRFARGAQGLAGARAKPFRVWLGDWQVSGNPEFPWRLDAKDGDTAVRLDLTPDKPPVLEGDRGLSRKGPAQASYYYSMPRLAAQGRIEVGGTSYPVTGLVWLDREWSTSALSPDQVGWDWFGLHLSDGSDLMLYQLRQKDGAPDPYSQGTLITRNGETVHLKAADFSLKPQHVWKSPDGAAYPVAWEIRIPTQHLRLEVRAMVPNQELDLTVKYWEGAVDATGRHAGRAVTGQGYLEMTGYAQRP